MGESTLQLDIPVLLPEVSSERDECIERLRAQMEGMDGIRQAHIKEQDHKAMLCLHYDPDLVSLDQVQRRARDTGARLSRRYRHETMRLNNLDCADCALSIEHILTRKPGVLAVSVNAASERMRIEYDSTITNRREIVRLIVAIGYEVEEQHADTFWNRFGPLAVALLSGLFLATGFFGQRFFGLDPNLAIVFYLLAYLAGGFEPTRHGLTAALHLRFDIDFLMVVAAIGAAVLGQWAEGAFLLFLFSLGHALEHFALDRARQAVQQLSELTPQTGRVIRAGRELEVLVEELERGDVVIVRPGERIPADGEVLRGESTVDQSAVTGESIPVDKAPGQSVFAGTINGAAVLEVKVTRLARESTLARVVQMVAEAQTQKSPTQQFTDRFEKIFVPAALAAAVLVIVVPPLAGWLTWQQALVRGLTLLVAASPCALAISTPAAVLAGIAQGARNGVLIKGGAHLWSLGHISALAFDKTGTITYGRPVVTDVLPLNGLSREELLRLAAAVESRSEHPLGRAVVSYALSQPLPAAEPAPVEAVRVIGGQGIEARLNGSYVRIGSLKLFAGEDLPAEITRQVEELENAGKTTMLVQRGQTFLGILALADQPREGVAGVMARLKQQGIQKLVMLTGDNPRVAAAVASQVGLTDFQASLLPGEKRLAVQSLLEEHGSVAMVGDGVNDAPALATATVGIAMGGAGSGVALETSDVALMGDDLSKLPFAVGLSRQANGIIRQNLFIALGVTLVLSPLAILGIAEIAPAIIFHEGSTILVALNALRLLGYRAQ